ncbi:MAG: lamin tail domain-containing protein, partial [Thermoanaerobaculales bacterium]|nr:lamin tail domain-containing protein [Thermoanaerobaculales bacterium]
FVPGHAYDCPAGWEIGAFDPTGGNDTPGSANPCGAASTISEVRIDQPGTDNDEYFELADVPGTSLDGLTYLVIGDGTGGSGTIEAVVDLTGLSIPPSGYFVAAEGTFILGAADLTTSLNFENSDNVTHLLVSGFSGANGDDLDTDDDGILDTTPWTGLLDCVALVETVGSGEQIYCTETVGPDGAFVPGHAYDCPAGWEIGAFDPASGDDTPGAANSCPLSYTPIYDIQYTTDPSGDSPLDGSSGIITEGVVTARFSAGYFIEDPAGGAWNGLYVYDANVPALGDRLRLTGTVDEFNNLTQLSSLTGYQVLSSGNAIPGPEVLATANVSQEQWEGVLVRVENVTVTNQDLGFGEWSVSDGSGDVVIDDKGSYTYVPVNGGALSAVIGPLDYTFGAFKIQPRDDSDIILPATGEMIINEILADPAADITGDANGDGTRDASQDEFVEMINTSASPVGIGGWTLADGFSVRHVFPGGTTIPAGCGIVVFGGGSPTGIFGTMMVQTASTGSLGLNNGGDTITLNNGTTDVAIYVYGAEGGNNQSLTRDPDITGAFVQHSTATGSGGALFSPGTAVNGTSFAGCAPSAHEIFEIQGSGTTAPYDGQIVTTLDNIVTGVGPEGFVMQTPDARADLDADTSNGIYVYTGGPPAVAVGDQVDVTGQVVEYYEQTEFTGSPVVTVDSSGNPLPTAIALDASTPSPIQPQDPLEFERLEGMLVTVASGVVTGSNQRYSTDPIAEVQIVTSPNRAFREPGVEYPGWTPPPTLPIWDGNPEVFELDPDRLGLPNQTIPAGSTFDAVGVIGFEFGDWELWPTVLNVAPAPLPRPVRARNVDEFTIGSF